MSELRSNQPHSGESKDRFILIGLAALAFIFCAGVAIQYLNNSLLERDSFRQTQTALSAYWMLREGWQFDYQTPVAGYPWAIPYEFPIYQMLVVFVVRLTGWAMEPVGRMVSVAFLFACAYPAYRIVRSLELPFRVFWVFCALLWSSPVYMFWGRSFMIESTAIFFAFTTIAFSLDFRKERVPWHSLLLCTLFATLACLQKSTTGGATVALIGLFWLAYWFQLRGFRLPPLRNVLSVAFALGLPVLLMLLWTHHSNEVKLANALGTQLTTSSQFYWNFGYPWQRITAPLYVTVFWERMMVGNAGGPLGAALLLGTLLYSRDKQLRWQVLAMLVLFAFPLMVFTNLHITHDYYQSGCALFLIGALALCIGAWIPKIIPNSYAAPLLTALLLLSNMHAFRNDYYWSLKTSVTPEIQRVLSVAQAVKEHTPENSAILVYGNDWNSSIGYYAQRKSFTVPDFFRDYDKVWVNPQAYFGPVPLSAIVVCPSTKSPGAALIRQRVESEGVWIESKAGGCTILLHR